MDHLQDSPRVVSPGPRTAILLCQGTLSADEQNIAKLLTFFAVPWRAVAHGEIAEEPSECGGHGTACVVSSAEHMAQAMVAIEDSGGVLPRWMADAATVYVYGFRETKRHESMLRWLTGDAQAKIRATSSQETIASVTANLPELSGPMSGIQIPVQPGAGVFVCDVPSPGKTFQSIIKSDGGELFFRVERSGVQFFLNGCSWVVDLNSPATAYFDVRKSFYASVPIVMYVKSAFREICWGNPETSGCLIVDDPPLKARYGSLRFRDTLKLMDRFNFTTSIGFIPWNWRRTDRRTVSLFQNRPDRFSLAIHGCDHISGEFATRSTALLNTRIKTAVRRMDSLAERTSLRYERIMVFPQGAFSPQVGRALKLNGLAAAVNTEVAPLGNECNETTIGDLWDIAIMKYGTFPIFTRRYLTHGIENFAFDGLLGKPCLITAHHDVFRDEGRDLMDAVAKLNSLNWKLRWHRLGDAISRSFKSRYLRPDASLLQMFAPAAFTENKASQPREVVFAREEGDPDCVKAVVINEAQTDFSFSEGHLQFRANLTPGETTRIRLSYFDKLGDGVGSDGLGYRVKTRARRHLSEFRDNYLSQSDLLYASATRIKQLLAGRRRAC